MPARLTEKKSAPDFLSGGGEMGDRIRAYDWSTHPLGRAAEWQPSLKTAVSLILNSQHPMWIGWGPEMWFLYNDAYLHVLSLAKHPWALGRPASEVWSEIWQSVGPLATSVFREGRASFVDEMRLFMNRGKFLEETYYSFSYSPIRDESGEVAGLFCPSNDVTSKVVGPRRLRTLAELSANALAEKSVVTACRKAAAAISKNPDDMPLALLYLINEGRAVLQEATGVQSGSDCAPPILDLSPGSPGVWPLAEVYRSGQAQTIDLHGLARLPHDAANQQVAQAMVLPIDSHVEGKIIGLLVSGVSPSLPLNADYRTFLELVARNIGTAVENAQAEEEEKQRIEALAEIDRAKTTFFSNVSHEFRTPLTLMLGPLEGVLSRNSLGEEDRTELTVAHRNSVRLLKLVNSLLDFSRIEGGRIRALYTAVDLAAFTVELASGFRSAIETGGLSLVVDCPPLGSPVFVDRDMWEKIILNLLSNAFKFTLEGSIAVRLRERDGRAVLQIVDTGVGIPQSELPHIFERFHRVENAKGRTFEGTGIGLALVQELVKMHGGSVAVESETGKGSVFSVELPLGVEHLPADRLMESPAASPASARSAAYVEEARRWLPPSTDVHTSATPSANGSSASVQRVLLAEDNADMREYIVRLLGDRMHVTVAGNGQEALMSALENPPDLVLTDAMMPVLDGFGLLRELRAHPKTAGIPIILLSARAGEEARTEGIGAGADDYLTKPFGAKELIARVTTALDLQRLRRQARAAVETASTRLESALNAARMVAWELELSSGKLTFSLNAPDVVGAPAEWDVDSGFAAIHPEDRAPLRAIMDDAVARRVPYVAQIRFVRPDNAVMLWMEVQGSVVSENPLSLGGVFVDITERKRLERGVQLLASIVDSSDDAIISKDLNGIITSWNKGAGRVFGYTAEETVGRSITMLIPAERLDEETEILGRLRRGERVEHFETIRRRKDGSALDVSLTISPVRDAQGNVVGASKIARDITRQKQVEHDLRRANDDLQQFAYSASHDLQEPLRTVKIFSELLSERYREKLDGDALEFLENVRSGAGRMETLIRDLLAYTQTAQSDEPLKLVDADASLMAALESLSGSIAQTGASVHHESLPRVRARAAQLQQLLQNLLGNAIKYHRPGAAPEIRVAARRENGTWLFSVADNGIGIKPQYREGIFGLFKRLHTREEYSGTGIGLSICQKIVERHHGRIWVESEPDRGSVFYFTIPE